jgi:YggT family protein
MALFFVVLRYAVFAAAGLVLLGAFAAMAVQARAISPFGAPARTIRRLTDPLLRPIEHRVLRAGGNPQSAPWWLVGIAVVGGIVLVSGLEWIAGQVLLLSAAASAGPGYALRLAVDWLFSLVILALIVRVIGSWIGATRYTRWMRPFVFLTEWLLAPLRRVIPPFGMFDITPVAAWLLLELLRPYVLRAL